MNFLIFFTVPLPIEMMTPEGAGVQVGLMIAFTVYTLEGVRAWFALFCFKTWGIGLEVSFTTPSEMAIVFIFVQSIALYTS